MQYNLIKYKNLNNNNRFKANKIVKNQDNLIIHLEMIKNQQIFLKNNLNRILQQLLKKFNQIHKAMGIYNKMNNNSKNNNKSKLLSNSNNFNNLNKYLYLNKMKI